MDLNNRRIRTDARKPAAKVHEDTVDHSAALSPTAPKVARAARHGAGHSAAELLEPLPLRDAEARNDDATDDVTATDDEIGLTAEQARRQRMRMRQQAAKLQDLEHEVARLQQLLSLQSIAGPSIFPSAATPPSGPSAACEHVTDEAFHRCITLMNNMAQSNVVHVHADGARGKVVSTRPVAMTVFADGVLVEDPNFPTKRTKFVFLQSHADARVAFDVVADDCMPGGGRRMTDQPRTDTGTFPSPAATLPTPPGCPTAGVDGAAFAASIVSDICHSFLPEFLRARYPDGVKLDATLLRFRRFDAGKSAINRDRRIVVAATADTEVDNGHAALRTALVAIPFGGKGHQLGGSGSSLPQGGAGAHVRRIQQLAKHASAEAAAAATAVNSQQGRQTTSSGGHASCETQPATKGSVENDNCDIVPIGASASACTVRVLGPEGVTLVAAPKGATVAAVKKLLLQSRRRSLLPPLSLMDHRRNSLPDATECPHGTTLLVEVDGEHGHRALESGGCYDD